MTKNFCLILSTLALSLSASLAHAEALAFHMNESGTVVTAQQRGVAGKFSVEIAGVMQKGITRIDGIGGSNEVVTYKDGEDMTTRYRPGNNKTVGKMTITREWNGDKTFFEWASAALNGKQTERKSISVIFLTDDGAEATLVLTNATPTGWSGPAEKSMGSAHAVESLTVVYENFDYKK